MENIIDLRRKNILVTGGAGFIGSHLVKELLTIGANVSVVDVAISQYSLFARDSIKKCVAYFSTNILDKEAIFSIIKEKNIEYIFHLAAQTLVTNAHKDPYATLQVNILGTVNILEASRLLPQIKGVVVASSDKAYGKTKDIYTEENSLQGDHPYDVSKSSADLISQAYFRTYQVPVAISRFGNVYGEGDFHFDRIIPGIFQSLVVGKPLEIRSDGKYVRDYIYVKDVVSGYISLLENIKKTKGQGYNFSSSDTLSVLELIEKIEKKLKRKIPYVILNNAKNEIPYQHLDDKKARLLGWLPKQTIDSTIEDIALWYKKTLL